MDSDQGKLFIGGISWETSEEELKDYFGNYGEVIQTVVMRDKATGRPRGFGFVVFADPSILDRVLQEKHVIDGRTVEAKRALSRDEQQVQRATNPNPTRSAGSGGNTRTKKIFVGGLPPTITEDGFRQYFESYGTVTDVVVMYDQATQRPRGFGFISFDAEEAVDRVLHKTFHDLDGKSVEVKRALPKDANSGGSRSSDGGGYQSYGGSVGNPYTYDGRVETNRYNMQPQNAGGVFPSYGSGYSAPAYGYGPTSNGMGYGGYGGYGGPAATAYGNPNVPNAGYPSGAPRSSWSTQAPSGYGAVTGGPGSGPTSQSPSGVASGYGNQGYGAYGGGYGASDGSYGYASGYGAGVARSGNGQNTNGTSGYENAGWKSDPSQASGFYGTQAGYGGAQARQAQQ